MIFLWFLFIIAVVALTSFSFLTGFAAECWCEESTHGGVVVTFVACTAISIFFVFLIAAIL